MIFDELVASLLPKHLFAGEAFDERCDAPGWLRELVPDLAMRFDTLASALNSYDLRAVAPVDSAIVFVRPVSYDLALRCAALQSIRARRGVAPVFRPKWLARNALGVLIRERLSLRAAPSPS